ncbi:lipopolysaccharide cholinephosphotransferase [Clostridium amylolyticum]|uniref:Lipopolysaccharide cholinephosphotransferase n=1 Tax=Clostridium amylolyticum TaxID=1121298 RepID=A0A1M6MBV9_9CLOT|nr:LicD family protein [Clostridium amylolyticum]SHJ80753.1 lipopolysaccharide cholinephosphotransferase [Clostridium amylolyticum]
MIYGEKEYIKTDIKTVQDIMLQILKEVDRICSKHNIKYFLSDGTLLGAIRHGGFIPWDDDLDISMLREDYNRFKEIAPKELSKKYFFQTRDTDSNYDLYHIPLKIRHNGSLLIEEKNKRYHQGFYIDVFPFDKVPDTSFKAKIQSLAGKLWILKLRINTDDFPKPRFFLRTFMQLLGKLIPTKLIFKLQESAIKLSKGSKSTTYTYGAELIWDKEFEEKDLFPLERRKFENGYFLTPNNSDKILTISYGNYMVLPPENERTVHAIEIYIEK